MKVPFEIESEAPQDADAIRRVETAAFGQAGEAGIVDAVRASDRDHISLVARLDRAIAGHALFSVVEAPGLRAGALGPIGVDPAHQGEGIGGELIRVGIDRCRAKGWQAVFLLGDPGYYSRFGFVAAEPYGYFFDEPRAAFQVQFLEPPGDLPGGQVRYHASFY